MLEIDEPQKIVYKDSFSDAEGNSVEGMPEMTITLTLEDLGGKTKAISKTTFADAGALQAILDMGVIEGFTQTWDRLENYLAAM